MAPPMAAAALGRDPIGLAELIADTFRLWCNKLGYVEDHPRLNTEDFCVPPPTTSFAPDSPG